jgi:hypothetical protein
MGENIDKKEYAIKDDGTIFRGINSDRERMNKEILEVIEVGSFSHRVLAAYQARKAAYKICKAQYGKTNYRDYVEMLMRGKYPMEYEKAEIGKKIVRLLCMMGIIGILVFLILSFPFFVILVLPLLILLTILFWVSYKKKYNSLCDNNNQKSNMVNNVQPIDDKDFKIQDDGTIVRGRKCPKCGKELLSDGLFCEYCGAKIGDTYSSDDMENKVIAILKKGKRFKLEAVKLYHDEKGVNLKTAKEYVDDLYEKLSK